MSNIKATPVTLDHAAIAEGLGELREGAGYSRVLGANGKTLAYLKKGVVAVPTAQVARLPKKLGTAVAEKSGPWSNVAVADTAAARAVLEYAVAQAGQS